MAMPGDNNICIFSMLWFADLFVGALGDRLWTQRTTSSCPYISKHVLPSECLHIEELIFVFMTDNIHRHTLELEFTINNSQLSQSECSLIILL